MVLIFKILVLFFEIASYFPVELPDHEGQLDLDDFPDKVDDIGPEAISGITFEHFGLQVLQCRINIIDKGA